MRASWNGSQEVAGQNQAERTAPFANKKIGLNESGAYRIADPPAMRAHCIVYLDDELKGHDRQGGRCGRTGGVTTTLIEGRPRKRTQMVHGNINVEPTA
jgi:hypothetical protein